MCNFGLVLLKIQIAEPVHNRIRRLQKWSSKIPETKYALAVTQRSSESDVLNTSIKCFLCLCYCWNGITDPAGQLHWSTDKHAGLSQGD